jgi:hypothetical protein
MRTSRSVSSTLASVMRPRPEAGSGRGVHHGIAANDDAIAGAHMMRRRAVGADLAGARRRLDGVGHDPLPVGDVVEMDLLVFENAGARHQIGIYRAGALVVEVGGCHHGLVQLGLQ